MECVISVTVSTQLTVDSRNRHKWSADWVPTAELLTVCYVTLR